MNDAFDCIVVLGHSARDDDPVMRARVRRGVELYQDGLAPVVIMSGRWSFKLKKAPPPRAEAWVMRDLAVDMGVPAADVLVEDESTDTLSNAYFTKVRFLLPLDWRDLCVVTSEEHAGRAEWLFRRVLGPAYRLEMRAASSAASEAELREGIERNERLLRQIQGVLAEIDDGDHTAIGELLFSRHPGFVDDAVAIREVEEALL